jgi:protein-disulfide isomerase
MSVQGTPALVLANGEVIPGYVPAAKLRRALDQRFP